MRESPGGARSTPSISTQVFGATAGASPIERAAARLFRQRKQVGRQVFHVLCRKTVRWHDRIRGELGGIGEVLHHPTARLPLGQTVQRRSYFHAGAVHHVAVAAIVRLEHQRARNREFGGVLDRRGVIRVQLQQKRRQGIQL